MLINHHIVVILEGAARKVDDILLGHHTHILGLVEHILPALVRDVGERHSHTAVHIAFERGHIAELAVVDGSGEQVLIPVAGLQNLDLLEQEVLELFQRLALFGLARQAKIGVVVEVAHAGGGVLRQLLLVDVLVDDTAGAVHQHSIGHLGKEHVAGACARVNAETDLHVFGLQTIHIHHLHFTDGFLLYVGKVGDIARLNLAEIFINQLNNLIRIKVARHCDTIVVRHIIGIEVLVDVGQRRVLQVLDGTDGGLRSVWVVREQGLVHLLIGGTTVVGHVHVLLLIHGFQLGVEQAEDRVGETLALDHQPAFNLVAGDILLIHRHIIGSEGVGTLRPDHRHHLVVLVGDGILGSLVGDGVDQMVDGLAFRRVGGVVVYLIQTFNLFQLHLFLGPVEGAEVVGAFEHQVFEIVGKARRFGGVVLAAHTHGDVSLDARHILVHGQEHLQTVVQRVVDHVHRVVLISLLVVILCEGADGQETDGHQ